MSSAPRKALITIARDSQRAGDLAPGGHQSSSGKRHAEMVRLRSQTRAFVPRYKGLPAELP